MSKTLHGWIKPEYAKEMILEMMAWLEKESPDIWVEIVNIQFNKIPNADIRLQLP